MWQPRKMHRYSDTRPKPTPRVANTGKQQNIKPKNMDSHVTRTPSNSARKSRAPSKTPKAPVTKNSDQPENDTPSLFKTPARSRSKHSTPDKPIKKRTQTVSRSCGPGRSRSVSIIRDGGNQSTPNGTGQNLGRKGSPTVDNSAAATA